MNKFNLLKEYLLVQYMLELVPEAKNSLKYYLSKLDMGDIYESFDIAFSREFEDDEQAFKYACGIMRNKINYNRPMFKK